MYGLPFSLIFKSGAGINPVNAVLAAGSMPAGQPISATRKSNQITGVKASEAFKILNKYGSFDGAAGDYALMTESGEIVVCPASEFDKAFEMIQQAQPEPPAPPADPITTSLPAESSIPIADPTASANPVITPIPAT